jgi:MFS transporter, putative metabolite:H+ symporter
MTQETTVKEAAAEAVLTGGDIVSRMETIPWSGFYWKLLSLNGPAMFLCAFTTIMVSVAIASIVSTLGMPFAAAGSLLGALFIGNIIGLAGFGYLGDRYGRRPVMIWSALLLGAMSLFGALSWDYWSFFASRLLAGIGYGGLLTSMTLFSEYMRGKIRGALSVILASFFVLGIFLTPLIGVLVTSAFGPSLGWRVLFGIGALPLVLGVVLLFTLPESVRWLINRGRLSEANEIVTKMEASAKGKKIEAVTGPQLKPLMKPTNVRELLSGQYRRRTALVWLVQFCTFFVTFGWLLWVPTLYLSVGHISLTTGLELTSLMGGVAYLAAFVSAWAVERGRKPFFIFGYGLALVGGLFGLVSVFTGLAGWAVLLIISMTLWMGCSWNNNGVMVYSAEVYPTRMRNLGLGIANAWGGVASWLSPVLIGVFMAVSTVAAVGMSYVYTMFIIDIVVGLAAVVLLGIETKGRPLEEISP